MARKPTYKELEKQIKELHNEVNLVREHNKEIQENAMLHYYTELKTCVLLSRQQSACLA